MKVGSEDEPCSEEGVARGLGVGYSKVEERNDGVATGRFSALTVTSVAVERDDEDREEAKDGRRAA